MKQLLIMLMATLFAAVSASAVPQPRDEGRAAMKADTCATSKKKSKGAKGKKARKPSKKTRR